jgi:hypothetical protein
MTVIHDMYLQYIDQSTEIISIGIDFVDHKSNEKLTFVVCARH